MYRKIVFILYCALFVCGSVEAEPCPKYNLSICAVFKNEAKFLKEWIEFHQLVGVDHFYLYDIGSEDPYQQILGPFIEEGIVTLIKWPNISKHPRQNHPLWALGTQMPAYENAIKVVASKETKWLIFLDTDEFLVPPATETLTDILELYQEESAVHLPEEFFDASPSTQPSPSKLIIENVNRIKAPKQPARTPVKKMIFKPTHCVAFSWPPYTCLFKDNKEAVKIGREFLRINRYINREESLKKGIKAKNQAQLDQKRYSEREMKILLDSDYLIEDQEKVILRFLPHIREKMRYRP